MDSYTPRYLVFSDGPSPISKEVNRRIVSGVEKTNSVSECNKFVLHTFLALEFLRPAYGQEEQFVNDSPLVPKENVMLS